MHILYCTYTPPQTHTFLVFFFYCYSTVNLANFSPNLFNFLLYGHLAQHLLNIHFQLDPKLFKHVLINATTGTFKNLFGVMAKKTKN